MKKRKVFFQYFILFGKCVKADNKTDGFIFPSCSNFVALVIKLYSVIQFFQCGVLYDSHLQEADVS